MNEKWFSMPIDKFTVHQMNEEIVESYDSEFRFQSYWKQIEWVQAMKPKSILYVGVGTGFVPEYLKKKGFSVTTADFDEKLKPDHHVSVTEISTIGKSFDLAMVCEVLEHISFEDMQKALVELSKISRALVVSVPENRSKVWLNAKIPMLPEIRWVIPLPFGSEAVTSPAHFWELNPKNERAFEQAMTHAGWKIVQKERVVKLATHAYYRLERAP